MRRASSDRSGLFGDEELVDQKPDRDEQQEMRAVAGDVQRERGEPSDDERPDQHPAHAVARSDAHVTARIGGGAPVYFPSAVHPRTRSTRGSLCTGDSPSTPGTPTRSSPRTSAIPSTCRSATPTCSSSRTTTSS